MPELIIDDTTGGLSTKSPTSLLPNQVAFADNMEWFKTKCGERRLGHDAVTLDGGTLAASDEGVWCFTHYPTSNPADAQLWVMALDGSTPVLKYKDTSWHTVTMPDAMTADGINEHQINAVSFHGKLFIAYNSSVDRLHVFITGDTALRRTGLAEPAAPTAADTSAGALEDTRYYRVRYTEQISGITVRRSEPSEVLTHDATAASGVTVTKPTTISEGETHWELEASKDNVNFYRIATTVVGTTTVNDTIADGISYSTIGDLSEDIGDYTLLPSARYLSVDEDRLMLAGSFEDEALNSRVMWTPVGKAEGVGNDERLEADTNPSVDLDSYEGGGITGISRNVNGYVYVFKYSHVYQGIRTGVRTRAYIFIPLTKNRGAIPGTIVEAIDNNGHPTLFALDRDVGPICMSREGGGVQTCGTDLVELWRQYGDVTSAAQGTTQIAVFFPLKRQIRFFLKNSSSVLVLHTTNMASTEEGFRGGWAFWTLPYEVQSCCLFANNIEDNTARSLNAVPYIAVEHSSIVWQSESGHDDAGEDYFATMITRMFTLGKHVNDIKVHELMVVGLGVETAVSQVLVLGERIDAGTVGASTIVDWSPESYEQPDLFYQYGRARRRLDDLSMSEANEVYVTIADDAPDPSPAQWGIDLMVITYTTGQTRGPNP